MPGASPKLLVAVEAWLAQSWTGDASTEDRLKEVSEALNQSSSTFDDLYRLGRTFQGLRIALPVYQAAVNQAEQELAAFAPGDPRAKRILDGLWYIGDRLWELKAGWETGEQLYRLLIPWDPVQPTQARTAAYLHAETIYMQGRYDEAATTVVEVDRIQRNSND